MRKILFAVVSAFVALACLDSGMVQAQEGNEEFSALFQSLSAGDRSVLVEGLKSPDHQMMTVKGSANSALWTALAKAGLMTQEETPDHFPPEIGIMIFSVTANGQRDIPDLMRKAIGD